MKKILLLAVALSGIVLLQAQGIYQLWGMTQAGGQNDQGVIFNTDGGGNKFNLKYEFNNLINPGYGPVHDLTTFNGKFYGMTIHGGAYNTGIIFEWNPNTGIYTKKIDLKNVDGSITLPSGKLILSNGKLYGTSYYGGNGSGAIFEWDPNTNIYTEKFDFGYSEDGQAPAGGLTMYNGKFYGVTAGGGSNYAGVIFEWDPATNIYTKKYDFNNIDGIYPYGGLTIYKGRLYGMTSWGGLNEAGIIFEWNPTTNVFNKKFDFDGNGGAHPYGSLTLLNGIFYGMTNRGGANNTGVIFKWDPTTNVYYKQIDFNNANGETPIGNLTVNNGKCYGMTNGGGAMNYGVVFEWSPSTNSYSRKIDFNGPNGRNFSSGNSLTLVTAPVAKGLTGSCITLPSVTINSSNNNQWVAITDEEGNAVAEIKANGNNLGIVTAAIFINNTTVREDANKKLYLDRNIAITPQFQPATAVDIRLYIKGSEYTALKNAVNSIGQTSGIDSINDIQIYKVNSGCLPAVSTLSNLVTTVAGTWENDYVLSASSSSFSSFYFAGKAAVCSAPVITQVHANPSTLWPPNHQFKNVTVNYTVTGTCPPFSSWLTVNSNEPLTGTGCGDAAPDWIITDNHHLKLRAERAGHGNGRVYTITVNTKNAAGNITAKKTTVTVPHHQGCSNSKGSYDTDGYIDANGDYFDRWFDCAITPNPSTQSFNLQVATASSEKIGISIFDLAGRLIQQLYTEKNQSLRFGDHLKPGMYMITVTQGQQQQIIKVIKE